jgi:hypothetical protein
MKKNTKGHGLKRVLGSNYNRVLLTEVLPYEVPILLTNEGFFSRPIGTTYDGLLKAILAPHKETHPFTYKIVRTASSYRTLHLIHPSSQRDFVGFYKTYHSLMCSLTSRSEFSLRAPSEVAVRYYEPDNSLRNNSLKDEGAETNLDDGLAVQFKYASSFFLYKKYAFLYKFYDSYEFHRIEKKFKKLLKFDISKCFDNISTKRLGETVKGEIYHKENIAKDNFENKFSRLMEGANFGRNDGLVIGPEFSRIFAEIILQGVDRHVYQKNLELRGEYDVRRYVDDYFLFYNDDRVGEHMLKEFQSSLEDVKLYFNESKISRHRAPFLTGITMAKKDIQDIFSALFDTFDESKKGVAPDGESSDNTDSHIDQPEEKITFIKFFKGPSVVANRLIRDIKAVVRSNDIEFENITGYFFTVIKNKIYEVYGYSASLDESQQDNVIKFLLVIIDVAFFVYSMDVRVRSTFLISQISILCCRIARRMEPVYGEEAVKKVQDEIVFIIKNRRSDKGSSGVEVVNLLIALREISGESDLISEDDVAGFIFNEGAADFRSLNYFQAVSILFYIKNNSAYSILKDNIKKLILSKMSTQRVSIYSEMAHLLLDLVRCPYLDRVYKVKLIANSFELEFGRKPSSSELKSEYRNISSADWFVDWSEDGIKIERLLQKKELKTPYE